MASGMENGTFREEAALVLNVARAIQLQTDQNMSSRTNLEYTARCPRLV